MKGLVPTKNWATSLSIFFILLEVTIHSEIRIVQCNNFTVASEIFAIFNRNPFVRKDFD